MARISILGLVLLTSCASMPELFKTVDDIATDDAVSISVDRDAFQKNTDVHVKVDVINRDPPAPATQK